MCWKVPQPRDLSAANSLQPVTPAAIGPCASAPAGRLRVCRRAVLDAAGATCCGTWNPARLSIRRRKTGELRSIKDHCGRPDRQMCVFEFIYFARPDSIIEGSSVHEARKQAGRFLAQEHPVEADVVIGVPDSGLDAALGYSQESGIPYGIGFIKNKYIGRTFIQGSQKQRENSVRIKLNVVTSTVRASGWCFAWMTPSCAVPHLPASSSCCGTPVPPRSTSAFRHRVQIPLLLRH